MTYQSVSPFDGTILKTFEELVDDQLETGLDTLAIWLDAMRQTRSCEPTAPLAKPASIINHPRTTPELPFGGIKGPGYEGARRAR